MNRTSIALLILISFFAVLVFAADPPEGYEWSSSKGALRITLQNPDVYMFDTYEPLTIAKEKIVSWGVTDEKNLTDLGKDLRARLLKIDKISQVFVGYRVIMLRKFPLDHFPEFMPEIQNALK